MDVLLVIIRRLLLLLLLHTTFTQYVCMYQPCNFPYAEAEPLISAAMGEIEVRYFTLSEDQINQSINTHRGYYCTYLLVTQPLTGGRLLLSSPSSFSSFITHYEDIHACLYFLQVPPLPMCEERMVFDMYCIPGALGRTSSSSKLQLSACDCTNEPMLASEKTHGRRTEVTCTNPFSRRKHNLDNSPAPTERFLFFSGLEYIPGTE
ncbi:hypothetical protein F4778DRAFT_712990 [Xylariomycetidae sp. FL2044]|nr:hypothetical protein F4778DRAFT_712990 [Xylariomycetidae sp. FL2044]